MPLSGGPSLTLASSPMSWQGEHNRLNTCSPAAASWAKLDPVEAASAITAITQVLIIFSVQLGYAAPGRALASFLATPVRMAFRSGSVNGPTRQFVANHSFARGA